MKRVARNRDEGMALILAVIFLIAMGAIVAFTTTRVMGNSFQVDAQVELGNAFEGAEAGMALVREELTALLTAKSDGVAYVAANDGLVGMPLGHDMTVMPNFGDAGVVPITLTRTPNVQFIAFAYDWGTDGIDNTGSGIDDETDYFGVYSFSQSVRNGQVIASRRVETIIRSDNVNVWKNAIFAGNGQAGNVINGNVSIHGSVHVLGNNLAAGGVALEAIDLGGTSLIHNNYEGLSADLLARVPALPTTVFNGEVVDTLNGTVRVKNGLLGMSGSSEIGEVDVFGNSFKETMDGVYVTDGWTGNDIDANGDPQSVYSDNGWDESYDLGGAVPFPDYSDDGGQAFLTDSFLEDFTYAGALVNAGVATHAVYIGDITLTAGDDSFYWNATTEELVVAGTPGVGLMPNKADLDSNQFYMWFDSSTNTLVTNGRIAVDGNISLDSGNGANNKTFDYEGKGTLLAYDSSGGTANGNMNVNANLLTTSFPGTNLLGLMAGSDMSIGSSSQLSMMGGFYTQGTISVNKQSTIVGTIVGNAFNMGTNVPSIFGVPAVSSAWNNNQRMIGANPVWSLNTLAWRELGAR